MGLADDLYREYEFWTNHRPVLIKVEGLPKGYAKRLDPKKKVRIGDLEGYVSAWQDPDYSLTLEAANLPVSDRVREIRVRVRLKGEDVLFDDFIRPPHAARPRLMLMHFDDIAKIRLNEAGDRQGEYIIRGHGKDGRPRAYDISYMLPDGDDAPANPVLQVSENGPGKAFTHRLHGTASNLYMINAVARRIQNDGRFLLLVLRDGWWHVIGHHQYGEVFIRIGGYTSDYDNRWHPTVPEAFEFECEYQLYPACIYRGGMDVRPIAEFYGTE